MADWKASYKTSFVISLTAKQTLQTSFAFWFGWVEFGSVQFGSSLGRSSLGSVTVWVGRVWVGPVWVGPFWVQSVGILQAKLFCDVCFTGCILVLTQNHHKQKRKTNQLKRKSVKIKSCVQFLNESWLSG